MKLFLALLCLIGLSSLVSASEAARIVPVDPVMITPFIALLVAIAVVPFISKHWWEQNYPAVSFVLGLVTAGYYIFYLNNPVRLFHTGVEYISFIALIGSLFVVTGGIFVSIDRKATPAVNTLILLIGAVVSNVLGTTGASAFLIRPFLRINKNQLRPYHVVFFIFAVSNIGGALTPIGDPPLFLGYLKGVPFFWVIGRVWHIWALALILVLAVFFILDTFCYSKIKDQDNEIKSSKIKLTGSKNFLYLFIIIILVLIQKSKFLSQFNSSLVTVVIALLMGTVAAIAYKTANKVALRDNEFNFAPIKEVAILFAGIFSTMVPALDWLEQNASQLGVTSSGHFYWGSGILSSFLDNAPTYLNFLSAAFGLQHLQVDNPEHMRIFLAEHWRYIQAISVGAVFFGANTYIGNGPNFMVKSIAEQTGADCPSFFGYIFKYSLPVLIPIFTLVWFLFFRGY